MLCDKLARPDLELTARHSAASTPTFYTYTGDTHMSRMKDKLLDIIEAIDILLGDGYAKKNPDLIGRVYQSEAVVDGWKEVIDAVRAASTQ